jgi:hypothetical protein
VMLYGCAAASHLVQQCCQSLGQFSGIRRLVDFSTHVAFMQLIQKYN